MSGSRLIVRIRINSEWAGAAKKRAKPRRVHKRFRARIQFIVEEPKWREERAALRLMRHAVRLVLEAAPSDSTSAVSDCDYPRKKHCHSRPRNAPALRGEGNPEASGSPSLTRAVGSRSPGM